MIKRIEDVWLLMGDKHGLPGYMIGGMEKYLFSRVPPGDFMRAVLENDLVESVQRADPTNRLLLRQWAQFLLGDVPREAWGSHRKVNLWIKGEPTDVI
jgi:hypothetical protein